jgi:hypothetical protein
MHTGFFWQSVYWLPSPVLAVLAVVLVRRGLLRELPFFFSYVVVAWARDLACLVATHISGLAYAYTYWISHLVSTGFMLLATYELFIKRLFPRFHKITFYRYLFSLAAATVVIMGTFAAMGGVKMSALAYVIRILDFVRVVILLFFVALMVFIGRQWSRYELGIALGLSLDSAAFLITFAIFLKTGPLHGFARDLPVFAYDLACLIWLITFMRPENATRVPTTPISPEILREAKEWETALKKSVAGKEEPGS